MSPRVLIGMETMATKKRKEKNERAAWLAKKKSQIYATDLFQHEMNIKSCSSGMPEGFLDGVYTPKTS